MPDYKYSFQAPEYQELQILDQRKDRLGKIRIKPSTILWNPLTADVSILCLSTTLPRGLRVRGQEPGRRSYSDALFS